MEKRISRLRNAMSGLDCFLVSAPEDVFYYAGYRPLEDEGAVLAVFEKGARLFTTGNGFERKSATVPITLMKKASDFHDFIKHYRNVGFDERNMLSSSYLKLKKYGLRLKPASVSIKAPRAVKSDDEIERMKRAIELTKKAFRSRLNGTEAAAAGEIDCMFRRNGANNAFETIVAGGKNSSNVHHRPTKKPIGRGLVIVDCGAKLDWYCADLTRTFCLSGGSRERKLMEEVNSIQGQLFDMIKPGIKMSDVQAEYEKLIKKTGNKCFHSFGHGVGLEVHEAPSRDDVLRENMVITVEPGIYVRNLGGCRKEDIVVIKKEKIKLLS